MKTINDILEKMHLLHNILIEKKLKIITAESCTAGFLSYILTYFSGASNFFDKGFIVYNDYAKNQILEVNRDLLEKFTAVSKEVCLEMVKNINKKYKTDIVISVTGYIDFYQNKEMNGFVYFGIKFPNDEIIIQNKSYFGGRNQNRIDATYDIINSILLSVI